MLRFWFSLTGVMLLIALGTSGLFILVKPDAPLVRKANQALRSNNPQEAARLYARARMRGGNLQYLLPREIDARMQAGDFSGARDSLNDMLEFKPGDPELLRQLAEVYQALGNPNRAVEAWGRYLVSRPEDMDGRLQLAFSHLQGGDDSSAESMFQVILESDPENGRALLALGKLYAWKGDWSRSTHFLNEVLQLYPHWQEARITLARVYSWMGAFESSVDEYRKALEDYS